MQKANPAKMRKAMDAVNQLKKAGVLFVPMPVLDESDYLQQVSEMLRRMDVICQKSE